MTLAATSLPPARRLSILVAALFAVVIWAATPVATKLAVGGLDPLSVGLLRTLLGSAVALPVILLMGFKPPASLRGRGYLTASALGGFVFFPILFSLGVGLTSAAHAALILGLLPVITGFVVYGMDRRWPPYFWWLGSGIAFAGTLLLVFGRFGFADPNASLSGDLLVLAGCLASSTGYVMGARAGLEAGTWAVTFWGLLLAGLLLVPVAALVVPWQQLAQPDLPLWGSLLYLALASSILAYAAWYWAMGRGEPARVGQMQFLQPLIGLGFAAVLLGEALTWPLLLAGLLIVAGVVVGKSGKQREKRT